MKTNSIKISKGTEVITKTDLDELIEKRDYLKQ